MVGKENKNYKNKAASKNNFSQIQFSSFAHKNERRLYQVHEVQAAM